MLSIKALGYQNKTLSISFLAQLLRLFNINNPIPMPIKTLAPRYFPPVTVYNPSSKGGFKLAPTAL
jgi:hypothetical protein